jgi:hypothetical protein
MGVEMVLNMSPSRRTGMSPFQLLYNVEPRFPLDIKYRLQNQEIPEEFNIDEYISTKTALRREAWKNARERMQRYYEEQHQQHSEYRQGQLILVKNVNRKKGHTRWKGPFEVIACTLDAVTVRRANGKEQVYALRANQGFYTSFTSSGGERCGTLI